jgi:lipopolysaccharide/colanic/teichoic acid biosynthesis glycosyltransferase
LSKRANIDTDRKAVRIEDLCAPGSQEALSDYQVRPEPRSRYAGEWGEAALALLLLVISSPLLLIAACLPKLADGGPVFWKGVRLGKGKKAFTMYKIRSLSPGAEQLIGARLITPPMAADLPIEHRFGAFLRDSHLDELPQFINVLKNDMSLVGPRPIRDELYEAECRDILGYDLRFSVRPGLFGYSQVLTPHSTDKRLRKKLDNHFILALPKASQRIFFLLSVLSVLSVRLPLQAIRFLRQSRKNEYRKLYRVGQPSCRVSLVDGTSLGSDGVVGNLNDSAMTVCFKHAVSDMGALLKLEVKTFQWHRLRNRKKTIYCRVIASEPRASTRECCSFGYVIRFEPASPLNHYLVQKYLLRRSLL